MTSDYHLQTKRCKNTGIGVRCFYQFCPNTSYKLRIEREKLTSRQEQEKLENIFFVNFPLPCLNFRKGLLRDEKKHFETCLRCSKTLLWLELCQPHRPKEGHKVNTIRDVTYNIHICSIHFIGGKGPTEDYPNPVPALHNSKTQFQTKLICSRRYVQKNKFSHHLKNNHKLMNKIKIARALYNNRKNMNSTSPKSENPIILNIASLGTDTNFYEIPPVINSTLNAANSEHFHDRNFIIKNKTNNERNNSTNMTLTCIPCQLDFATKDDFEFHAKTHVESIFNESSNSGGNDYQMQRKYIQNNNFIKKLDDDPYGCGNPYDLLSAVVAGASTVLKTMSNIAQTNDELIKLSSQKAMVVASKIIKEELPEQRSAPINIPSFIKPAETISNESWILSEQSNSNSALIKTELESENAINSNHSSDKKLITIENSIKLEMKRQSNITLLNFKCNLCNQKFLQKSCLLQHTRRLHAQKFKCTKCGKEFSYEKLLHLHNKNLCSKDSNRERESALLAPVIDLNDFKSELDFNYIVGFIPIEDAKNEGTKKLGIPVLSREAFFNRPSDLPIVSRMVFQRKHEIVQVK